ncbi:MAG TPA: hypothetical protein VLM89_17255 [Phycisphaerae bacterium]|nr:hypothetical protein [Phycisphaerae bacterium]
MARKHHKPNRSPVLEYRQLPVEELRNRVRHYRQADNLRAAIDVAKECYRREPTPEHAQLLGSLYIDRGRQLIEKNLHAEALMVLNNALALGQGSVELLHMVFECGLRGGQYASAAVALNRLQDPADRRRASCLLADEAVVRGEVVERLCEPAVREDAGRIRRAFAAFEKGDDSAAAAELKAVGLTSPCAGWKWLLLGLMAFVRSDKDRARTSWERAVGGGRAACLSSLLRSMLTPTADARPEVSPDLLAKAARHFDNPRAAMLQQIKEALTANRPDHALEICGRLLAGLDADERGAYALRLARAIAQAACKREAPGRRFLRLFGPLPEDPRLVRTAAIDLEKEDPLEAIGLWKYFLDRLAEVKAVPPHLRGRATALIWERMGDLAAKIAKRDSRFGSFLDGDEPTDHGAVSYYRNSLRHDPADLRTHEKLMDLLIRLDRKKHAERQASEILQHWPANIKGLLFLGKRCVDRDAFRKALGYFERARQAEPFNDQIRDQMQYCYLRSARRRMEQDKFDLAREDYRQAESLRSPTGSSGFVHCKWAALEWRAGDAAQAEALVERALACDAERVSVCLQLVVELEQANAPLEVRDRFALRLEQEWHNPPTAAAAAAMALLLVTFDKTGVEYPSRKLHDRALIAYLDRAGRELSFTEEQLMLVCTYLMGVQARKALEPLARQGVERFPANHLFVLLLGHAQLHEGGGKLPKSTIRLLDETGRRAMEAGDLEIVSQIAILLAEASQIRPGGLGRLRRAVRTLSGRGKEDVLDLPFDLSPPPRRRRQRDESQLYLFEDIFGLTEDA